MTQFYITWILLHTLFLAIGFAIGLFAGLKVPVFGDTFAVLIVGLLIVPVQNSLLADKIQVTQWVGYSVLGVVIGVALSFLFIFVTQKQLGLKNAHIIGFPVAMVIFAIFQSIPLSKALDLSLGKTMFQWIGLTFVSVVLGCGLIYIISIKMDMGIELLGDRKKDYSKAIPWGINGLILGVVYGVITGLYFS